MKNSLLSQVHNMKRIVLALGIAALLSTLLLAQANQLNNQVVTAFDHEQITISNTSKALTAAKYNPTVADAPTVNTRASVATIDCDDNGAAKPDNQIRAWYDGTAPTSTTGVTILPNTSRAIYGYGNIVGMRFIRSGGNDVICQIHYYRVITNAS